MDGLKRHLNMQFITVFTESTGSKFSGKVIKMMIKQNGVGNQVTG